MFEKAVEQLVVACRKGSMDSVKYEVEKFPRTVNMYDEWKRTPLTEAAQFGHFNLVKYLIEAKANPDLKSDVRFCRSLPGCTC